MNPDTKGFSKKDTKKTVIELGYKEYTLQKNKYSNSKWTMLKMLLKSIVRVCVSVCLHHFQPSSFAGKIMRSKTSDVTQ